MDLFKYIIIAIIQGITEPLPVSSSGHMFLFRSLLNTNMFSDLNYEIVCNFGSFIAIFLFFRKDIFKLIKDFFIFVFNPKQRSLTKKSFLYCIYLIISTIPVAITGLLFKDFVENKLNQIYFLGFAFLITSLVLYLVRNIKGKKEDFDITFKDAIIIGLFQAITIFPGISRSGTVLVACLICKLSRNAALKYTFILYFPVSVGSMILGVADLVKNPNLNTLLLPYGLGMLIAGVITYFSYEWLSNWVKKGKLAYFSIYCLFLSAFIFIYFR